MLKPKYIHFRVDDSFAENRKLSLNDCQKYKSIAAKNKEKKTRP
jgi:hypothetical protein